MNIYKACLDDLSGYTVNTKKIYVVAPSEEKATEYVMEKYPKKNWKFRWLSFHGKVKEGVILS